MLQSIHDRTHGWIAGIVLGLVILSFAGWGIHSYLVMTDASAIVAKVNSKTISRQEVATAFERAQRQLLQPDSKSGYQPSPQADAQLRKQVLQDLINNSIMTQALKSDGYRTDKAQLENFLEAMPQFQQDGQFSPQQFANILANTQYSMQGFLDLITTSLLAQQLQQGIQMSVLALPNEVTRAAALWGQQRDVGYLLIPSTLFAHKKISISDADIENYYQQHAKSFDQPAKVSLDYLELSVDAIAATIHPDDTALQRFYSANQERFSQNGKLKPFAKVRADVAVALSHQLAQARFATQREQLASLTYEHADSLQAAAQKLGLKIASTAEFTQDQGNKEDISANANVRTVAFSADVMENHNNSDVIQIDPMHVVVARIKHVVPAAPLPLLAVREQIVTSLQTQRRNQQLQELAAKVQTDLSAGHLDPTQVAKQYDGVKWQRVGWVSQQDKQDKQDKQNKDKKIEGTIVSALFNMPASEKGGVKPAWAMVEVPAGYAVVGLFGVKAGDVLDKQDAEKLAQQLQEIHFALEFDAYQRSLVQEATVDVVNGNS